MFWGHWGFHELLRKLFKGTGGDLSKKIGSLGPRESVFFVVVVCMCVCVFVCLFIYIYIFFFSSFLYYEGLAPTRLLGWEEETSCNLREPLKI